MTAVAAVEVPTAAVRVRAAVPEFSQSDPGGQISSRSAKQVVGVQPHTPGVPPPPQVWPVPVQQASPHTTPPASSQAPLTQVKQGGHGVPQAYTSPVQLSVAGPHARPAQAASLPCAGQQAPVVF